MRIIIKLDENRQILKIKKDKNLSNDQKSCHEMWPQVEWSVILKYFSLSVTTHECWWVHLVLSRLQSHIALSSFELVFTIVLLVNKNQVSNVFVKMSLVTCWWWLWHQSMWCTVTPNIINIFIVMNNNSTFSTAAATTRYFLALAVIATLFSIGTVDARLRFVSYDSKIFYRQIIFLMTGTRCQ